MSSIPAALEDLTWKDDAQDMLTVWARTGLVFSADDLRKSFRPAPHSSMVGAAFSNAAQAGIIRRAGDKESAAPSRRHSLIRTWIGACGHSRISKDDLTTTKKLINRAENAARTNQPRLAVLYMARALDILAATK